MTTFQQRNQLVSNPEGLLVFLELVIMGQGTVAYLVNDVVDWQVTRGTNTYDYIGLPFRFDPPKATDSGSTKATLTIDNAGRGMSEILESLDPQARIFARIHISDTAEPNVIQKTFYLPMSSVTLDQMQCTAVVGTQFLMSQSACKKRYTPNETPGIF